ncbi:hypothetical protein TSAR_006821 [Trichomalopsis sarcophagae]|uniref:Uncharacterized protein n=1 Tax=Trichomalopsis sarcophagae TaxID=543379 RepID=A0A232F398_9HYME|nr:hypothetical protein TSAR_006821 [Trichomalopsis sarcophagae]
MLQNENPQYQLPHAPRLFIREFKKI